MQIAVMKEMGICFFMNYFLLIKLNGKARIFAVRTNYLKKVILGYDLIYTNNATSHKNCRIDSGKGGKNYLTG